MEAEPASDLDRAVAALERGGVAVYPTETLYGLGADATSEPALRRVTALKGRDRGKPISVLVASRAMLSNVVEALSGIADRLAGEFWPGALTLVLRARPEVSTLLTGGSGTIGVRISSHPLAQTLVERLGRPLTATSANPGGLEAPVEVEEARRYFASGVDAYLDGGRCPGGPGSTIIECLADVPVLLREGAIAARAIESVSGRRLERR